MPWLGLVGPLRLGGGDSWGSGLWLAGSTLGRGPVHSVGLREGVAAAAEAFLKGCKEGQLYG